MTVKRTSKDKNTEVIEKNLYHAVHPEELLDDGELILEFSIPGQPATKKHHKGFFAEESCLLKHTVLMKFIVNHFANLHG